MRMTHTHMYGRLVAGDPSYDGRFFTGVLTTGIYCLPSCRARKPRAENVKFYPSCEAARAAGFRACRKCHPDDYARGADPVLSDIETLVGEIRAAPERFAGVDAIVARSGFGATRLFELFRLHYHSTPAEILLRARLETARRILSSTDRSVSEVALESGFESLSAFHDQFRRHHGLTPAEFRALEGAKSFALHLPEGYPLAHLKRFLGRDPSSATERLEGNSFTLVTRLDGTPASLRLSFSGMRVDADWEVLGDPKPAKSSRPAQTAKTRQSELAGAAHRLTASLLGLGQDASSFARLAGRLGLERLVAGREELRVLQTPSAYEGLLLAFIGQQVNLRFAFALRKRLVEKTGVAFRDGLYVPPTALDVARLDPESLRPLQFSRQKAGYIVEASRLVAEGKLDLDALRHGSATRAERTLLEVKGLGPWSVNYLMMRALGFADCVPIGDTGVTSGLKTLFHLEERPDADATRRLMTVFAPYRSLATAQLWQINQPLLA